MTDDLAKRLRDDDEGGWVAGLCAEAADRIEAQAARIAKLEEALRMIAYHIRDDNDPFEEDYWGCRSIARAALGDTQ